MQPPPFWLADPNDPDEDPALLFFASAQNGFIDGMEMALRKNPQVLIYSDNLEGMYALHIAAASLAPKAVDAVRWLLEKGFAWCARDGSGRLAEEWARMRNNQESWTVLRNWAIEFEYELYYTPNREGADMPFLSSALPFISSFASDSLRSLRLDGDKKNKEFCNSSVFYLNPPGAPEDEVALVTGYNATGVMMEWERPIMRETARLLLDGMPTTGLRVLNIGFGIGMIDTYFQDAQPAEHIIIEAHPTCLEWMGRNGWYDRPGVRILEGRWQDFFPSDSESPEAEACTNLTPNDSLTMLRQNPLLSGQKPDIGKFDVVYFDTFDEGYCGHVAFIKNVPGLLRGPGSRFSYFNGHAKGNIQYQVFMEVARLHHNDLGMNTEYFSVHVDPKTTWYKLEDRDEGVDMTKQYTIPICALAPTVPRRIVPKVGWNNIHQPKI